MEIGQLEAFLSVVREGSFTLAAARLNLRQPSLSARIRQLEHSLGGQLFQRDRRPVQLTDMGTLFLDYAERAVGILKAGREAVEAASKGVVGRVTVTCPFSLATFLIPEVVMRFSQSHPEADLSIEAGHSNYAVSQLLEGMTDLAFAAAFPRYLSQTQTILRLHDEMVPAVMPEHALAQASAVPVSRLWRYPLIVMHWGHAFDAYLASLRDMSRIRGQIIRVPLPAASPLARQTGGIVFMPRRFTAVSGLVELDVPEFRFDWDVVLLTRTNRSPTAVEQAFVDTVLSVWHSSAPDHLSDS